MCDQIPLWIKVAFPIFHVSYMILEWWLGKTNKTKAASVLEWFGRLLFKNEEKN